MDSMLTKSSQTAETIRAEDASKNCILVFDPDKAHAGKLNAVLDFLGYDLLLAYSQEELAQQLKQYPGLLTIIITGDLSEAEQQNIVKTVTQEAEHILPVVLYSVPPMDAQPVSLRYPPNWIAVKRPIAHKEFSNALDRVHAHFAHQQSEKGQRPAHLFRSLIGRSPAMQHIRREIEQVGPTDATVLILGESGTGKEVVARNLHYHSKRRGKAFVPVNCGAIPRDLLESELFGHEKGAFTGALTAREGRFALAAGGTLFLDEIGEMPMDMQVKLLRVLEERTFERVGGSKTIKADVRIVAATNCNLEQMVADGTFREDLFYRLEVFPINLPPLRERIEDLPMLIAQLNDRMEYEKHFSVRFSSEVVSTLSGYPWPGNVRELANLIERLGIKFPNGMVEVNDLPMKYRSGTGDSVPHDSQLDFFAEAAAARPQPFVVKTKPTVAQILANGQDMKSYVSEVEKNLISQALEETDGVIAHAAKLLGLRRTTLTEKMRKYGLQRPKEGRAAG